MTQDELDRLSVLNGKQERKEFITEKECREFVELIIKMQTEEITRLQGELVRATTTLVHAGFKDNGEYLWQAPKEQAVPEGYRLMPPEPTPEMIKAWRESTFSVDPDENLASGYDAMFLAAPEVK